MEDTETRTFSELISELQASAEEVASLARNSESERDIFTELAILIDKLMPVLEDIKDSEKVMDKSPIRKAAESLELDLRRTKALIKNPNSGSLIKQIEDVTQDLGRSLGLIQFASLEASTGVKEKIGALRKELMNVRFDVCLSPSSELMTVKFDTSLSPSSAPTPNPSRGSGFGSDLESEKEIEEERVCLSAEDIVLQIKYGNDEDFRLALVGLSDFVEGGVVDNEWISVEGVIPILFNRLGTSKRENRLTIIRILRILASKNAENKEKMADSAFLSMLVKSLARDVEERREAVGLLLDLSDIHVIRRRSGKIQGCIVMLVAILNGDDPVASQDAGKLLNALSSNTQNALHMAEAGYFKPLVQYLREGSDMTKILMATALSRMGLTDQRRATLGKDGAIDPLVKMFIAGKLEAKLSALNALQNLSRLTDNIQHLINSGLTVPLLQLLFSVTSVLMTLREPASAILARIAQSESILVNQDVAQQMLSLLNLSSPGIQYHLLEALNSIAAHSSAFEVRSKMQENGAIQLLWPFLTEGNAKIRTSALNLLYTLSKDPQENFTEQLGETHLNTIVCIIISSSTLETEKAAAIGILSNLPIGDKKATDVLKREILLPILSSIINSSTETAAATMCLLQENVAGVLTRFTDSSDKKLQLLSVELGVIPLLVKLLSIGSVVTKSRAAISLAQLSQSSLSLRKSRKSRWLCIPPADAFCEVHDGYCHVKTTFCLVKAGAISPLIKALEGQERHADEAVLSALATLLQDEIWENGSNYVAKMSGVEALIRVLESGNVKVQEIALWMLERIFRIEEHRAQYGDSVQVLLIDLALNGDPRLKPTVAKILAQLELLQIQSSYF
ncbi:hypothetical protein HS088_TW09G00489 [Tripterygium wilfordii]|uniref:U-box domain-containing protein 44-like n=1 Tax=Tripterygium wilfordii TaxID=458696 RepID=A0A7J7D7Z8_TRIWF|nr:U-box domain-containing protein 24-like [Tripterygium wilfordii]XP_038712102.1 U-box domain-containing protein 24-like [Tripterygium wilfordii]XP_038712103.1 U-box domain-containing protein 24-like [Tripterygium wilfordii]KAF5742441.1 hypothetical protein HS088_TW09G00489 [Tripterygium wilfordii]